MVFQQRPTTYHNEKLFLIGFPGYQSFVTENSSPCPRAGWASWSRWSSTMRRLTGGWPATAGRWSVARGPCASGQSGALLTVPIWSPSCVQFWWHWHWTPGPCDLRRRFWGPQGLRHDGAGAVDRGGESPGVLAGLLGQSVHRHHGQELGRGGVDWRCAKYAITRDFRVCCIHLIQFRIRGESGNYLYYFRSPERYTSARDSRLMACSQRASWQVSIQ